VIWIPEQNDLLKEFPSFNGKWRQTRF